MAGLNIKELATSDISLSDYFAKADENGLATKNTIQGLANILDIASSSQFRGSLAIADTPTLDGWYFASETGTYTNAGSLVIDVSDNIAIIIVADTQTTFSKVDTPITLTIDAIPTEGSTNAVQSGGVKTYVDAKVKNTFDATDEVNPSTMKATADYLASETEATPTPGSTKLVESGGVHTAIDLGVTKLSTSFYQKKSKAIIIERTTLNEFDFNDWVKNVELIPDEGVIVDISSKEIYLSGYLRQIGTSGITLNYGVETKQINIYAFSGDMVLSFYLPSAQITAKITLENVPTGIFSNIADFQRADFDNDKINIFQNPTAEIGIIKKTDTAQNAPAWVNEGLFRKIQFETKYLQKYVTLKLTSLTSEFSITNRKENVYPATVADFNKYVVFSVPNLIKGVNKAINFSQEFSVAFGKKFIFIVQSGKIVYKKEHINTSQSKWLSLGQYNVTGDAIEYIKIEDYSVFENLKLSEEVINSETISVSKKAEIPTIFGLDNDIEINLKDTTTLNQKKFEALGGEVVTGTFGNAGSIYRIKPKLSTTYRISTVFSWTEKLLENPATLERSIVRTEKTAVGVSVPNTAFAFNIKQDNGTVTTKFIRGVGNYTRENDVEYEDNLGYGAFRIRWTGLVADGLNYTLTVNDTNLIIKNGATTILSLTLASYTTQHEVLKALIDANIPNISINVMHLSDSISDFIHIDESPLVLPAKTIVDAPINSAYDVWVYNIDEKEHKIDILSNPSVDKKFYYKFDGEINDVLEKTSGEQTSPIEDWIYFGGFGGVSAPVDIKSIKISNKIEQDEPKIIVLMVHTADSGLVYEDSELIENGGTVNPYFHTSTEHLGKWKMLLDELGYSQTSIEDIRDYARFGTPISNKAWCIIFDDQQTKLWDVKAVRDGLFDLGIKPITAWITGFGNFVAESLKRSLGHGWQYINHTHNHLRLGEMSYEEVLNQDTQSQQNFYNVTGKETDIMVAPFGSLTQKTKEQLQSLGYNLLITTEGKLISPKGKLPLNVTRIDASETNDFSVLEEIVRRNDKY